MLYLMDIDGTVVRSFMRESGGGAAQEYDLVEVLPGRRAALDQLSADGHAVALVTNQGGVAFGYQTQDQVIAKMMRICEALGLPVSEAKWGADNLGPASVYVSFGHPQARVAEWRTDPDDDWRKPGGGMIVEAIRDYRVDKGRTVFVGDRASDEQAAVAAGVVYIDAVEFFGPGA